MELRTLAAAFHLCWPPPTPALRCCVRASPLLPAPHLASLTQTPSHLASPDSPVGQHRAAHPCSPNREAPLLASCSCTKVPLGRYFVLYLVDGHACAISCRWGALSVSSVGNGGPDKVVFAAHVLCSLHRVRGASCDLYTALRLPADTVFPACMICAVWDTVIFVQSQWLFDGVQDPRDAEDATRKLDGFKGWVGAVSVTNIVSLYSIGQRVHRCHELKVRQSLPS